MTSELKYIITNLRQQIENNNVVCPLGFDGVFRDPASDLVYLRKFDTDSELDQFGIDDRLGNFFYLRFDEVEQSALDITTRLNSDQRRVNQTLALRAVFAYQASNIFEVGDYLLNVVMGLYIGSYRNISNVQVIPTNIKYDYFNWDGDDTGGLIRTYLPYHQSTAIDFNVIFARDYDECRNPPNIN